MSPYSKRVLETGTTFYPEDNGTWLMADFNGDGIPDLIYIKTRNTGTGKVEVHVASGASNYQKRIFEAPTTFEEEDNGTWLMAHYTKKTTPDLIYIKNRNTGTGQVEVHVASSASKFQQRVFEAGTTFVQEDNGTWLMTDWNRDGLLDLVYLKTSNTGTGETEVHVATGASSYQTRIFEAGTTFIEETNGTWLMTRYTTSKQSDLAFIKTRSTGTGRVEVHIASGQSNYRTRVLETGTTFYPEEHGTWLMTYYTQDNIPDLAYIKTSQTGTGRVEVHIASGT